MDSTPSPSRLIIVSNRLPIVLDKDDRGAWTVKTGSGGLVTALAPVLRNRGGLWIGWPGVTDQDTCELDEVIARETQGAGYTFKTVNLTDEEEDKFYRGFANEIVWPLFHDFMSYCVFNPEYWETYKRVNSKFADKILENAVGDDFVWVHDYHLMYVAREIRKRGIKSKLAFYLHIPFPPLDIFVRLPWRFQILYALLDYDLIGFQTLRDRRNFIQCVRTLLKDVKISGGKGQVASARWNNREIGIGAFPISIDYKEFEILAESQQVGEAAWYIHEELPERQIILGVDRLDYTKGIPERIRAFARALRRYPELKEARTTLVQVVVPSRRDIPKYIALKEEIEGLVGRINGEFTEAGYTPIHYIYRGLNRVELLAYYRTCEIALITPLKDGMNLVAKEFCASDIEEHGVLILSEFAGTAAQLSIGALMVNPHDIDGVADAIYEAFKMPDSERRSRMHKLRRSVRRNNIFLWVDSFLQSAISRSRDIFPIIEDYVPKNDIFSS
ncbi:MAG: trehalose-6-phosphate synthase [candidate division Zixibacteria bacterium]|nr:trehalose-6-phosphate synthase [candidate division Zixibacteria bacterium]